MKTYIAKQILLVVSVFFIASLMLLKAASANSELLTESKIKAFYKEYISIQMGYTDEAIAFLKRHIHNDFEMKINVINNMEGSPSQKQELNFNKDELLSATRKGMSIGKTKSVDHNIISIKISDDGKSAKVKDSSFSIINLSIGSAQMSAKFIDEQSMLCDTTLVLGDDNRVLIKNSVCNSEDNIRPVE